MHACSAMRIDASQPDACRMVREWPPTMVLYEYNPVRCNDRCNIGIYQARQNDRYTTIDTTTENEPLELSASIYLVARRASVYLSTHFRRRLGT